MPPTGAVVRWVCRGLGRWWRCWGVAVGVGMEVEVVGEGGVLQRGVAVRWQEDGCRYGCRLTRVVIVVWLYAGWVLLCG